MPEQTPTIVLVHGVWADAASWDKVIPLLQEDGFTVYAPPNPLRGLPQDSAYLHDFLTHNPVLRTLPGIRRTPGCTHGDQQDQFNADRLPPELATIGIRGDGLPVRQGEASACQCHQGPTRDSYGSDPRGRARQWCHRPGKRHTTSDSAAHPRRIRWLSTPVAIRQR